MKIAVHGYGSDITKVEISTLDAAEKKSYLAYSKYTVQNFK